jgi:hypothetical protein
MPAFSAGKSGRQDLKLSPENHNALSNHDLQDNQEAVLAKNCPKDKVAEISLILPGIYESTHSFYNI